jgi:hypothetical protein
MRSLTESNYRFSNSHSFTLKGDRGPSRTLRGALRHRDQRSNDLVCHECEITGTFRCRRTRDKSEFSYHGSGRTTYWDLNRVVQSHNIEYRLFCLSRHIVYTSPFPDPPVRD